MRKQPIPVPVLRDCDRELIQTVAGRLRGQRTVDVVRLFYTQPEIQAQLADRDSRTGERVGYMSGLVVAEVGIRKMGVALGLALVLLAGCARSEGPVLLNPGASVPWYVASRHDLTAEYIRRGGSYVPNAQVQLGFYDRDRKEVWTLDHGLDVRALRRILAPALHEVLVHFTEDQGGDAQTAAARLSCPTFDLLFMDADPMAYAAERALREAKKVTP